jgi:molybdopterin molybdotransferase
MRAFGCEPRLFGIAPDDPAKFRAMFEQALAWGDIVVTTAGVSMGEHDVVGGVVRDLGAEILFWKSGVRPGKPMLVARFGEKPYFGLPGNPVAVCCNTEIFLKPFLRQAMGIAPVETPSEKMRLAADCERDPNRLFFVFATAEIRDGEWTAAPLPHQSSGNLHNPARASVLLVIEPGPERIPAGTTVNAMRIVTGR